MLCLVSTEGNCVGEFKIYFGEEKEEEKDKQKDKEREQERQVKVSIARFWIHFGGRLLRAQTQTTKLVEGVLECLLRVWDFRLCRNSYQGMLLRNGWTSDCSICGVYER